MSRWRGLLRPAGCGQAARFLQQYLDGELDEVMARRVARHLDVCRRCGLEARTYAQIKNALARRGAVPPDAAGRLHRFAENLDGAGDDSHRHEGGQSALPLRAARGALAAS